VAWDIFGNTAPGWGRVQDLRLVNRHIRFDYLAWRAHAHRLRGLQRALGVCRDFAHLALTFCRCLNIPARYINAISRTSACGRRPDGFFRLDRSVPRGSGAP